MSINQKSYPDVKSYISIHKDGRWHFQSDRPVNDGTVLAIFDCLFAEHCLPGNFWDLSFTDQMQIIASFDSESKGSKNEIKEAKKDGNS